MDDLIKVIDIIKKISKIANSENKKTGFSIGNTAKENKEGLYFTPIRNTTVMVLVGVIVYNESQAMEITKKIDGKVDYILVDAEKKISVEKSLNGEPVNVERAVRELVKKSTLWIYKGNDLSVEAVDILLTQLTKNSVQGIGGVKVTILGAGNLGTKLALKLVERGALVTISRRQQNKLNVVVKALNYIKPRDTTSMVIGTTDNTKAANGAEILIGATQGIPVITSEIVKNLADKAFIVDVGKGTLYPEGMQIAEDMGVDIYRLDISAALDGLVSSLWESENIVNRKLGRRELLGEKLVSGGLLGRENEMVVDNVWNPTRLYGIADGKGDFIRNLSDDQSSRIEKLHKVIEQSSLNNSYALSINPK